jgi:hypothetical protein
MRDAVSGQAVDFCPSEIFFFFLVGRNSVNFAPRGARKSFAGCPLASGGGAKLSEFRPGGATKIVPGEALFIRPVLAGRP